VNSFNDDGIIIPNTNGLDGAGASSNCGPVMGSGCTSGFRVRDDRQQGRVDQGKAWSAANVGINYDLDRFSRGFRP
jgi:hypothetical protein